MMWFAFPHLNEDDTVVVFATQNVHSSVINNVFNISLVSVSNKRGPIADITSLLSIRVDGISNGTNVSCITVSHTESRIILKQGLLSNSHTCEVASNCKFFCECIMDGRVTVITNNIMYN